MNKLKEKIAVIAMANRFPGSNTPEGFRQQLLAKDNAKTTVTAKLMQADPKAYLGKQGDQDLYYCLEGGFIEDQVFDPSGYQVEDQVLTQLDPLFQWTLQAAKEALQQAGLWGHSRLARCGVILGNLSFPTASSNQLFLPWYRKALEFALVEKGISININEFTQDLNENWDNALIAGLPANIIAKACGLGATSFALDAACASSCYAAQLACHYLQTHQADLMLAGAVSAADPMFVHMGFSLFHAFPPNQIHAPFDQHSEGLFAGQGAGMLLLKRLSDAEKDQDKILAVIEGCGLSNDGQGEFVLSPNKKGQLTSFERAYQEAQINPAEVDYIECHATGTPKGDKLELDSMESFFKDFNTKPLLGSVKSNLGHLLTAAGMPSMMKVIQALNSEEIPATISIDSPITPPNGFFNPSQFVTDKTVWPESTTPATAAVSVFGFGGSNAHMVLRKAEHQSASTTEIKSVDELAIIGIEAHFGDCDNFTAFAKRVTQSSSTFSELPEKRWKGLEKIPHIQQALNFTEIKGGFIDSFEVDCLRFKMPPNDEDQLIPQQLLMMKVADNALQQTSIKPGQHVAVITAMGVELDLHQYRGRVNLTTQIKQALADNNHPLDETSTDDFIASLKTAIAEPAGVNQYTSFIGNIMASRIAALWDFSGPALTISSEQNATFKAIELARTLFQTTEVEAVVVAAVDLAGSFENFALRQSRDQFNDQAVLGEGAGAIVLTRADTTKDPAFAHIKGFAQQIDNQDCANQQAIYQALENARSSADDVELIQAYQYGDQAQQAAERQLLAKLYPKAQIHVAKSQIGHSFNADFMVSLLSAIAFMQERNTAWAAINGYGDDEVFTHMILKQGCAQYRSIIKTQKTLMKKIQLGGNPIQSQLHITENILEQFQAAQSSYYSKEQPQAAESSPAKATIPVNAQTQSIAKDLLNLIQKEHQVHQRFLDIRLEAQQTMMRLINSLVHGEDKASQLLQKKPMQFSKLQSTTEKDPYLPVTLKPKYTQPKQVIFNQADLITFAEGRISDVFGEAYAAIDQYHRRVRLPTTDYLLVSRVTDLQAEINCYEPAYMATEYDIPIDAPFLIDGQIPWSVAVESGQCDLMLISYLGIDFINQGNRVYRLLDCELTFLDDMAFGGQTLRYEIHIDSYAKNGDQLLFFFHYDCFVEGKKVLIMRGGCAGFFTDEELDEGKGVILTDQDIAFRENAQKQRFTPLIANNQTTYDFAAMQKLVKGDIAGCLGAQYEQPLKNPSLQFSSEKFLMIERVSRIEPQSGHWGLGVLYGHKKLAEDHWYFPCHFKDDQVMAGSLMSEGCGQLAMFYMLWLGMHLPLNNARFQPVPGASQKVRCRGQVTPQSNELTYRMEVTHISMTPVPTLSANIDIILDGKVVVDFQNLSVMIKEQQSDSPYARKRKLASHQTQSAPSDWLTKAVNNQQTDLKDETGKIPFANVDGPLMWVETDSEAAPIKGVKPIKHRAAPMASHPSRQNRVPDTLPFTPWHLFEFATGDIAQCFGEEFSVYRNRIPPRTPCGDLQLVTTVESISGQRHELKKPASCRAIYEVPMDAWYFKKNAHPADMPFSILMEIALQPNGFISGYMGTTLAFKEQDLFFRNLDGSGKLLKKVDLRGKTIVNESTLLSTSMAGGSIIQSFEFTLKVGDTAFFEGTAVFGYFSEKSLTHQLGLDNGKLAKPWFDNKPACKKVVFSFNQSHPFFDGDTEAPYFKLQQGQLNFLDEVTWVPNGGEHELGYLFGKRTINPADWFFRYHFHQDPVMPGSLGVEACIEMLKVLAMQLNLGKGFNNPRFSAPLTTVKWKYRGQITPLNQTMTVDAHITSVKKETTQVIITANANLYKDSLRIYQVTDLVLAITES